MKKVAVIIAGAVALAVSTQSWGAGGVEGSVHDFTKTNSATYGSWNSRNGVCSACHAAHHTDPAQLAPLWVHATTTASFTPYSNPNTLNAVVGQPDGVSLACLSCHDGTLGVNTLITVAGTNSNSGGASVPITGEAALGTDLHTTHPISFTYDAALAAADGGLEDPTVYTIGSAKTTLTVPTAPVASNGWQGVSLTGKTIKQALLFNDKMQCSSCHDVHKLDGNAPSSGILLRISGTDVGGRGSLICRTCHIK
jgi:hypothetical protein